MAAEFHWPIRVYYEDTDAGGIVYYANYLRFMERARTEWLRYLAMEQDHIRDTEDCLFVVRRCEIDYKKPALFNDEIIVTAAVTEFKKASMIFFQQIWRGLPESGELLCSGQVQIASISASTGRPKGIPKAVLEALKT